MTFFQRRQSVWLVALVIVSLLVLAGCGQAGSNQGKASTSSASNTQSNTNNNQGNGSTTSSKANKATSDNQGSGQGSTTASNQLKPLKNPVTVKIAEDGSPSGAGFYIADSRGYFKKYGINVKFVNFKSSGSMLPSIAASQVDVAGGIMTASLVNAVNRGLDIKIIGDKGRNIPGHSYFDLVIAKSEAKQIKTLKDLKGKTIAIAGKGGIDEIFLDKALKKAGLTEKDVHVTVLKDFSQMNAALSNGKIDAAMDIEPQITQGVNKGILERWIDATKFAPNMQVAVMLASPKFVKNKKVAKRFMVAYVHGLRDYMRAFNGDGKDLNKIIDIMTQYTPMKDKKLWHQVNVTGFNPDGKVNVQSLQNQVNWFKKHGDVKKGINVNKIVDMEFANFAAKQLGPYKSGK